MCRGITLFSVPGKLFGWVFLRRLTEGVEVLLRKSQCGFHKGRVCVDQVFFIWKLAKKARRFNTPLYLAFVDLKKAYDSVNRE